MSDLREQLQEVLGVGYRIERELGGAGMSRVFLAVDTELERQVVIKVLPPELAAGINVDRFRREIHLAARLNHPHIVPLLSAGAKGALLYYTMPFITGESLRARLTRTRELPIHEATKILKEVADALAYAHSEGVVHRDIKPENVLLSRQHALVTDFGVSKALASATGETTLAHGGGLTSLGIALGTPAYMAPEQAAADPMIDHRADIYSLGVLGYELVTGRTPFSGLSPQQVLSAQVTQQPEPVTRHRAAVPTGLATLIMQCLEKNPADRWQTAEEVHAQLEAITTPSGGMAPVAAARRAPFKMTPRRIAVVAGAAGLVIAVLVLSTIGFRGDTDRFVVGNTRRVTNEAGIELNPAISPDGRFVAYMAGNVGAWRIFVRPVDGGRAVALTDSGAVGFFPAWTPDGSRVTYTAASAHERIYAGFNGGIYSVPILGGAPTVVFGGTPGRLAGDAAWSPDGKRVAFIAPPDTVYVADADGGNRNKVAIASTPHSLAWSPDGWRLAYVVGNLDWVFDGNFAASSIWVADASGGRPVRLTDDVHLNMSPVWTPDGKHILFVSSLGGERDIYSQLVDGRGRARGEPARLTTGLGVHSISLTRDGRLLSYSILTTTANVWSTPIPSRPVTSPAMRQVTTGNQTIESFDVTPDGRWLAYDSNVNGNQDIFTMPLGGGEPRQITRDRADDFAPSWSPDGSEIAFHSFRNGNRDIYVTSADGSRTEPVVATSDHERAPNWSPDGRALSYQSDTKGLYVVRRTGSAWGKPQLIAPNTSAGRWSPEGRWILAFTVAGDVVAVPVGGGPGRKLASTTGIGGSPAISSMWSSDGRTAYYVIGDADGTTSLWSVPVIGGNPTRLIHFADPARQPYIGQSANDRSHFYFSIGSRESDVFVMELAKK